MVKFTIEQLRLLMDKPHNIRNMSVIAHGALHPFSRTPLAHQRRRTNAHKSKFVHRQRVLEICNHADEVLLLAL